MPSVVTETRSSVCEIVLNEPARRNPLNTTLVAELIAALEAARRDPAIVVVLLRAEGDSFCAGGDLKEFQGFRDREATAIHEEGRGTAGLFKLLGSYGKPIVAAVNGPAFGGGFGLACACPIVIASERARFGATELRLGLFPLVILPALRAALGDRKALEMSLLGEPIDAAAAERLGVVTRVVAHDRLLEEARAVAGRIGAFSPYAVRMGMEAFRNSTGMAPGMAEEYLSALRVMFYHSEDLREGATAFLEKRAPVWRGR